MGELRISRIINQYLKGECKEKIFHFEKETITALCEELIEAEKPGAITIAEKAVADQIKLVGSKSLYDRLDKKLKEGVLDTYLIEEQTRLYHWRLEFFRKYFGEFIDDYGVWSHSNGMNPEDSFHTIPYQITHRFDEVLSKVPLLGTGIIRFDEV